MRALGIGFLGPAGFLVIELAIAGAFVLGPGIAGVKAGVAAFETGGQGGQRGQQGGQEQSAFHRLSLIFYVCWRG
ncbi:hypothetical protein D3C86_2170050 [compost metagenome]